jgi:hypothetical protein
MVGNILKLFWAFHGAVASLLCIMKDSGSVFISAAISFEGTGAVMAKVVVVCAFGGTTTDINAAGVFKELFCSHYL